jgi:FkbM family methyltransferase
MATADVMAPDLIFDIGMHTGLDTAWYLAKGFRVVAVEANPTLARQASETFAADIAANRLHIENVGLADVERVLPFYVNLENDEWSSFNKAIGTRKNTRYQMIDVPCITPQRLFERFGVPYFVKIDIEGFDHLVVRALAALAEKPRLASVEDNGFISLVEMYNAGCRGFKFMDQVDKWKILPPDPPLEGRYVKWRFGGCTSGPFGEEVPGPWMPIEDAARFYLQHIRQPGRGLVRHWWDIHGRFDTTSPS